MHQNLVRRALACAALVAAAAITTSLHAAGPAPLKVAFVLVSPIGEAGWSYQHNEGRLAMQRALGDKVTTTVVESVAEGPDSERVMRDLASQGHRLIFATSFGYLEPALRVAAEFPQVTFEHAGGYRTAPNVNTYNARYYEARYLAGMIAGQASKSRVAGYVAGFPVPEVIQGINAFALGMRSVAPNAVVRVLWLNRWFDPAREHDAALALIAQGADVLTNHSGSPAVAQTAEARGVKVLSYQSDMKRFAPTAQLASVTHHWGSYYTQVARSVLDGTWRPQPAWGGIGDGLVQLSALSPSLPANVVQAVEQRRADIVARRFQPFAGPLVDQSGALRLPAGAALSDEQIAKMNWFVEGVVGSLP